ncbi:Hypothetical predicted protein [Podarcis lilfordi]|uniref:Stabilizer of axonemal microtubules 2 n=1 Tax=Podarcis lilfordi TaxID=74358 RepID=A0AA35LFW1_9SAUR|nr:Hypothetical predicted protein [Podarcis lilfordi]
MESPPFKECLCELCDCGRHKCHRNCRKQRVLLAQPKTGKGWLSHYKATYTCPPAVHPRSSKRPPCTPPHPNPPPMDLQTTQRAEFVVWDPGKRTGHPMKERGGQHPQGPFQSQALCQLPFPPRASALSQPPSKLQPCSPAVKNSSGSKGFKRELPDQPGVNVITTPSHPLLFEKGAFLREKRAITKSSEPAAAEYVTKYQSDFPEQRAFPGQAAPALPPLDNLAINPAFRTNFQTVHRESYRSWNASAYSRAKLITLKKNRGAKEAGKSEEVAVTKLPYHLPVLLNHAEPIKHPGTALKSLAAQFDNSTAHRFFFRDWGAQPRIRYGDPWEGSCTHSLGHFGSQTTTCSTYLLKRAEKAKNYKPELKPTQTEGGQDFATIHREAYRHIPLPVCRLQMYLAQQQKSRKEADD